MLSFWESILGMFSRQKIIATNSHDKRTNYIFYKIVEAEADGEHYILQCINTSVTLRANIADIIFERKTLSSLHPVQACYIGIEYSSYLQSHRENLQKKLHLKTEEYLLCRYGAYQIAYEDRIGNICFVSRKTKEEYLMDPRDIALSKELINEFDAVQAFYIGYLAGLKLKNPVEKTQTVPGAPYLKIVK